MAGQHLHKDELFHECEIRGVKAKRSDTAATLRRKYQAALAKEEKDGPAEVELDVDVPYELAIIASKIEMLKDIEAEFRRVVEDNKGLRARALIKHIRERLHWTLPYCEEKEQRQEARGYLIMLKEVVHSLKELTDWDDIKSVTTVVASSSTSESSRKKDDEEGKKKEKPKEDEVKKDRDEDAKGSGGARGPSLDSKAYDFHKWNVSYTGAKDKSVLSFVMDVEEKARYRGIGHDKLMLGVTEFFDGYAKNWFRTVQSKIDSWEELKIALRREFLPMDYMENLWEEVRNRKQGPDELISVYITNVLAIFGRMELVDKPIDEELKLNIVTKNMAPFYLEKLALTTIYSLDQLKTLGRQLEVARDRTERYEGGKGRPRPTEPEFAYKGGKKVGVSAVGEAPGPAAEGEKRPGEPTGRPPTKCWKCGGSGHRFRDCGAEVKGRFCYGCGRKDTIRKECPKCSPQRGGAPGGDHPSSAGAGEGSGVPSRG